MSAADPTEAAISLLAARDALAEALTSTREAMSTITTSLSSMQDVEVSAVAILVAKAKEMSRLLTGRVRETVTIFADLEATPAMLDELARVCALIIEAGEAAVYRTGCVELHIQLAPAASEASR